MTVIAFNLYPWVSYQDINHFHNPGKATFGIGLLVSFNEEVMTDLRFTKGAVMPIMANPGRMGLVHDFLQRGMDSRLLRPLQYEPAPGTLHRLNHQRLQ